MTRRGVPWRRWNRLLYRRLHERVEPWLEVECRLNERRPVVSSLAAMLNAASTIFAMDVYKKFLAPAASQATVVRVGLEQAASLHTATFRSWLVPS